MSALNGADTGSQAERRVAGRTRPGHRLDVQGLRGVAVLMVVLFHAGVGPRAGFLGVDIFFVISGFVIGRSLSDELHETGAVRLGSFYGRRVRRLLPALALFTVVTAAGSALLLNPYGAQQFALRTGAAATVFVANLHLYRHTGYFDGAVEMNPFLHTWSLSVEEQFFIVLPAVLAGIWLVTSRVRPSGSRRAAMTGTIAVVGAGSLLLAWLLTSGRENFGLQAPERFAFFAMPTRIWEFCAGALLALCWQRLPRPRAAVEAALGAIGLGAILVAAVSLDPIAPHPGGWAVVTVAGTCLVIAQRDARSPAGRLLSVGGLVRLGDISYGWYLWHWPAIVFARVLWPENLVVPVLAAALALIPAVASYRLVEQPIRVEPRWRGRRTIALGLLCVAVPLAVIGGLLWGASTGLGVDEPLGWYDYPISEGTQCHIINRDAANDFPRETCTFGPDDATGTVMVVGDNTAKSVTPAVVEAAGRAGLRTMQWSRDGCPYVDGAVPIHYEACAEWQSEVDRLVAESRPDLLVIANQSPDYVGSVAEPTVLADGDGGRPASTSTAIDQWQAGMDRTMDRMSELGVPVLVVGSIPDFGDHFPRSRLSVVDPDPAIPRLDRDEVDRERDRVLRVERSVVDERPGTWFLDPVPLLCTAHCAPTRADTWLYLGPNSLTNAGSLLLVEEVDRLLNDLRSERPG